MNKKPELRLYTRIGRATCAAAKEFLSRHRIEYLSRDVFADPEAKKEWEDLGLPTLPCAVQGERRVLILHTDQLRSFLGLQASEAAASYRELAGAMNRILTAVERAVLQVPSERLSDHTESGPGLRRWSSTSTTTSRRWPIPWIRGYTDGNRGTITAPAGFFRHQKNWAGSARK